MTRLSTKRCMFIAGVALLLVVMPVTAGPGGFGSLPQLSVAADAIVVGSVQAVGTAGVFNAIITVERVLKGTIAPGRIVSLTWSQPVGGGTMFPPNTKPLIVSGHGVFFLQLASGGTFSLMPVMGGPIQWAGTYFHTPASAEESLTTAVAATVPANATPFDKVAAEMVVRMETTGHVYSDPIDDYRETQSPVLAAAFTRFLSSQNPELVSLGLRGSVLTGDPALIGTVRAKYATLSAVPGWSSLVRDIRSTYVNTSAQAIQALGATASDATAGMDLRIAAAGALARMHTQQTLPYLAGLLADDNTALQAAAVGGLSSFANNVPIGSHEPAAGPWPYRTDDTIAYSVFSEAAIKARPAYYLDFWKTWWQANRAALGY
ncbi:MAG: HEAT repeat domain-containing protein [Bryobacteraceae bacterium]